MRDPGVFVIAKADKRFNAASVAAGDGNKEDLCCFESSLLGDPFSGTNLSVSCICASGGGG